MAIFIVTWLSLLFTGSQSATTPPLLARYYNTLKTISTPQKGKVHHLSLRVTSKATSAAQNKQLQARGPVQLNMVIGNQYLEYTTPYVTLVQDATVTIAIVPRAKQIIVNRNDGNLEAFKQEKAAALYSLQAEMLQAGTLRINRDTLFNKKPCRFLRFDMPLDEASREKFAGIRRVDMWLDTTSLQLYRQQTWYFPNMPYAWQTYEFTAQQLFVKQVNYKAAEAVFTPAGKLKSKYRDFTVTSSN